MEWSAAIYAIAGLLLFALKQWLAAAPKRNQEAADDATQQGRADIADGDAAAVSDRVDRLLSRQSDPARQPSYTVTRGRIISVAGLVDTRRDSSQNP